MFQKTAAGKDVDFKQSYGSSGEQTRAVKAGLDADIVALSLAPDVDELVAAGKVDANWKKQSYKGMVTNSVVVFVVRDGNPKKIKSWNDLLRAGRRHRHAEPVHLGRRALEHHGRLRRLAEGRQDRQAGPGQPAQAVEERRRPGHERARIAEHVQQRQGRRPARVRERGAVRAHAGPRPPVRHPEGDDPDREPDRGRRSRARARRPRTRSSASSGRRRRSRSSRQRLPADREERREAQPEGSRSGPASSRSTSSASAAGRRCKSASSTRATASWRASSARSAAARGSPRDERRRRAAPARPGFEGQGLHGPVPRLCHDLPDGHGRAAASPRSLWEATSDGRADVLGRRLEPGRRRSPEAHARRLGRSSRS